MMRGNREMRRMLDKMGLNMQEMENIEEVVIKTDAKEIYLITTSSILPSSCIFRPILSSIRLISRFPRIMDFVALLYFLFLL